MATPFAAFDASDTMHGMIEKTALKHPEAIAITDDGEHAADGHPLMLSYRDLDQLATELSLELVARGLQAENCVAVAMNRSVGMVVALLAIQKAGGAFVALDPSHPSERKVPPCLCRRSQIPSLNRCCVSQRRTPLSFSTQTFVLADCQAKLMLTNPGILDEFVTPPGTSRLLLDYRGGLLEEESSAAMLLAEEASLPHVSAAQLCYMYYTSGSTGAPKGVLVEHRNVVNQLHHFQAPLTPTSL